MKHVVTSFFILTHLFSHGSAFAKDESANGQKQFRILRHERLQLQAPETSQLSPSTSSDEARTAKGQSDVESKTVSFTALGQQFTLILQSNDDLLANVSGNEKNALGAVRFYRGTIKGVPDSWVRLTQNGERWSGMLWDGVEAFLIDSSDDLAAALPKRMRKKAPHSLIYRLSETVLDGGCMLEANAAPLNDYQALTRELRTAVALPATTRQLNVAVVLDPLFVQASSDARAAALARMNVVDGIYSAQVGVHLNVVEVRSLTSNGVLTATSPSLLLNQFGTFTTSPGFSNPGIAHLITGRDLDSSTVGIAYLSSLCSARYGIGVTEIRGTGTAGALIIAHEMGHNFGAPHDNQGGSACATTPGTFIMNPFINGSDQFSPCSLTQMQPVITNATCITTGTTQPPPPPPPPSATTIFSARFDTGADGFGYVDDAFSTTQPSFATGQFSNTVGFSGGGLQVLLGGLDDTVILNMSGGWRRTFSLPSSRRVLVSLRYNLTQAANYEGDEFSDALLTVDGRRVGAGGSTSLARIAGDGNGGAPRSTGWVAVQVDLGTLAAGSHTLTIGGFNNKKTFRDEATEVRIDDVVVTAQ